ncbi:hypothetical protein ACWEHA_30170 [Amycolatopsis nivea]
MTESGVDGGGVAWWSVPFGPWLAGVEPGPVFVPGDWAGLVLGEGLVLPPGLVVDPAGGLVLVPGLAFVPGGGLVLPPGLVFVPRGGVVLVPGLVPGLVLVLGDGLVPVSVFAPGFGAEFVPGLVLGFPALGLVLGFSALVPGPVLWLPFWPVVLCPPWFPVLGGFEPVAGVLWFALSDEPAGLLPGEWGLCVELPAEPFVGALEELEPPVEGELAPPGEVAGWEPFAELELVAGSPVDGLPLAECSLGAEFGLPVGFGPAAEWEAPGEVFAEFDVPPFVEPWGEFWLPGELLVELVSGEGELFWPSL